MTRYKILFAEDVPDDMELAEIEFRRAGIEFESIRTETREEFLKALNRFMPDVVITDYTMPTFNGMDALNLVLQHSPYTPVIIHTGSINEETAVKCMKAGAFDYVLKEKIMRLPYALKEAYEKSIILKQNELSQTALKISETKYKGLFNSIAQGVFYIQENEEISTINPAASEILFLNTDEKQNLNKFEANWQLSTESDDIFNIRDYVPSKFPFGNSIKNQIIKALYIPSDLHKWLLVNVIPQTYIENEVSHQTLIVIEDITERKRAEMDLLQAKQKAEESDRLKSSFLSNLSHEVRTPMNAILGFSELLSDIKVLDENERFFIETIQNNSTKLLSIITDLIEMSKIETEKIMLNNANFEVSAIKGVILELYGNSATAKGVNLLFTGFNSNVILFSDEQKIKKILTNLVDNALKFTDQGEIRINCIVKPGSLEIHVSDTGSGVPEGHEELIFHRFRQADETFSRKHGGTGLGLSIARAYAEALGGKLWYIKNPNGAEFAFNIPVKWSYNQSEPITPSEISENPDYSNFTFLVAEDDATNFAYLTKILSMTRVNILYASNGAEAVELINNNPGVDMILMDIRMPIMDGYEATEIIRKDNAVIPIIATTAYAMSGDKEKCITAGCNAYISKPIKKNELFDIINRYLAN